MEWNEETGNLKEKDEIKPNRQKNDMEEKGGKRNGEYGRKGKGRREEKCQKNTKKQNLNKKETNECGAQ